jgi:RimJ/RimL family protein N-acetyltransferase
MNLQIDWNFSTPRVRARLVDRSDRELYRALYTDPKVMALIGKPYSVEEADELFEKVLAWNGEWPMRSRYWRTADLSGKCIGILSMTRQKNDPGKIELGQMILPDRQSKGFGMELAVWLVDLLMNGRWEIGGGDLVANNASDNFRVNRIGERLGFESLGKTSLAAQNEVWLLTRDAWLSNREMWLAQMHRFSTLNEMVAK